MEGFVSVYTNIIFQYRKKYILLNNFILLIKDLNSSEEQRYHIKYINITETKENILKLHVSNLDQNIFLKLESEDECLNWSNAFIALKNKYEKFLDEFYVNNNSENLLVNLFDLEHSNLTHTCEQMEKLVKKYSAYINEIKINSNLQIVLNMQNNFISKVNSYMDTIQNFCPQYSKLKPEELLILGKKPTEVFGLLEELKELILSCTFNLNTEEIIAYISNFKEIMIKKINDINLLIQQIKYIIKNYLFLYTFYEKDHDKFLDMNSSEISNLIDLKIANERMRTVINDRNTQTEIIKMFMEETD